MRHGLLPLLAMILTSMFAHECAGIVCFYCTIQPPSSHSNQSAQLCSKFDYSSDYHVECPYSTLCMKRTFQHTLQGGKKVKVSERGCAPQKRNEQVYKDGKWQVENKIEGDVYRVGCELDEGLRSPTEYCYCMTNLCNSANSLMLDHSVTMAGIFLFSVLKYIQSIR